MPAKERFKSFQVFFFYFDVILTGTQLMRIVWIVWNIYIGGQIRYSAIPLINGTKFLSKNQRIR